MAAVGYSTGCFKNSGRSFGEIVKMLYSSGATAIEINWGLKEHQRFLELNLSEETIEDIKKFDYVSVHMPTTVNQRVIEKVKYLCEALPVKGVVVHPDVVKNFDKLEKLGLPILIENMDIFKKFGGKVSDLDSLMKYNFGFVLDLQHVYEHDPTMKLAKRFIEALGDRLKHFHVSGCTKEKKHFPTHLSDNKEAIAKILELDIKVPKIAEGPVLENIEKTAGDEIKFIKSFEKD